MANRVGIGHRDELDTYDFFLHLTPPQQLENFKKRLCKMDASIRQIVYIHFHNPTFPRDFSGSDFLI